MSGNLHQFYLISISMLNVQPDEKKSRPPLLHTQRRVQSSRSPSIYMQVLPQLPRLTGAPAHRPFNGSPVYSLAIVFYSCSFIICSVFFLKTALLVKSLYLAFHCKVYLHPFYLEHVTNNIVFHLNDSEKRYYDPQLVFMLYL